MEGGCIELATGLAGFPNQKVKQHGPGRHCNMYHAMCRVYSVTLHINSTFLHKKIGVFQYTEITICGAVSSGI